MTLADISMMPFVARLAYLDLLDVWLSDRPASKAWWKKVQRLPSFKAAIEEQLSEADIVTMKTSGGKIRTRVAERRQDYLNQVACSPMRLQNDLRRR